MNPLGLSVRYKEVERIDIMLANRTIDQAVEHRVPVSSSIVPHKVTHGAMDNFDHEENT